MATLNCINRAIFILPVSPDFCYLLLILTKLPAQFSKHHCGLSHIPAAPPLPTPRNLWRAQSEGYPQFGMVQNNRGGLLKRDPVLGEPRGCRLDQILLAMLFLDAYSMSVTGHGAGAQLNCFMVVYSSFLLKG